MLSNVIFDKLAVIGDHVLGDPRRFKLAVEQAPLRRRRPVVVEHAAGVALALRRRRIDVLAPRPLLRRRRRPLALLERNRVLVVHRRPQRVLVATGNALVEVGGVLGVLKEKADKTVLDLERVEELAVLVVLEVDVELLVPDDAAGADNVDKFEEIGVADVVVDEGDGAAEPRVRPRRAVRVGDVQAGDGGIDDLVQRLGDVALHLVPVAVVEDPHGGREGGWSARNMASKVRRGRERYSMPQRRNWSI